MAADTAPSLDSIAVARPRGGGRALPGSWSFQPGAGGRPRRRLGRAAAGERPPRPDTHPCRRGQLERGDLAVSPVPAVAASRAQGPADSTDGDAHPGADASLTPGPSVTPRWE